MPDAKGNKGPKDQSKSKKDDKPQKPVAKGGKDKIDQDQIEEDYGLSYALFKAFPELDTLLKKAVDGVWTAQKFQVELRQTKWFKKHSDVWREMTALSYSDPATFQERLANTRTGIENMMGSVSASISSKGLDRLARRALLFGMSDDEIRDVLANHVKPSERGNYGGELSSIESDLRQTALRNGVTIQPDQMKRWMQSIVRGDASRDQFVTNIRELAAKQFSLYGDQIRGGMDLADVATPYMQSMADILELNPTALTLTDPTIRRALAGTNLDGKGPVPMSISDFEDTLRKDSRFMYTKHATRQAESFASRLAQQWGLI